MDMNMMASCEPGGKERTLEQFSSVAREAGYRLMQHVPLRGVQDLVELQPLPQEATTATTTTTA